MTGFVNALAILIIMAQLPELIGVPWLKPAMPPRQPPSPREEKEEIKNCRIERSLEPMDDAIVGGHQAGCFRPEPFHRIMSPCLAP